jgi:two-component system, NtrC family, sensor kinase
MNERGNRNQTEGAGKVPQKGSQEIPVAPQRRGEQIEDLATRALLSRPGLSIRARFIIGFLVIFLAAAGVTVAAWVIIFRLDDKLEFVDRADRFANEIQQCRRYEKNFFLYGTGLTDVRKNLDSARKLLIEAKTELGRVVGVQQLEELESHLEAYNELVFQLVDIHRKLPPGKPPDEPAIENKLREHGAKLVDTALLMSRRERNDVRSMLHLMRRLNLIALAFLLIGMIYMANFLTRHFLRRLDFLMGVTKRVGEGDFRPIMPVRKYRDEFTNLSLAMNHMMYELASRQEQLVQARKIAAVGTLTAGIAHEINNPVNNISLILESLAESAESMDSSERQRLYQEGMEQCERVSDIVKNLLEFSRASHPRREKVSLEEVVDKTAQLVANEMKLNDVRFSKEVQDQLPELQVDKGGLQQVLLNLFLNSIQAMPNGGELKVVIRLSKAMNEGILDVKDTGQGIPPEDLQKIFDPFYTTKKDGEGTGLGLSVSYSIIERHGGRIEVQSTLGEGSTFSIVLPFERPPY